MNVPRGIGTDSDKDRTPRRQRDAQRAFAMLSQEKGSGGRLAVNFGKQALEAFEEVRLWASLGFNIPAAARQLQADGERLQLLRGNVTNLVSHYNKVCAPPRLPLL